MPLKLPVTSRYRLQLLAEGPRIYRDSDLNMLSLQRQGLVQRCASLAGPQSCGWELTLAGHEALVQASKTINHRQASSLAYSRTAIGLSSRYPHDKKMQRKRSVDDSLDMNGGNIVENGASENIGHE